MRSLSTTFAALVLQLLNGVDGFWRMNCAIIQTGRVDPLVNPNAVSAHVHTIVGASSESQSRLLQVLRLTLYRHWREFDL